jgi:hypothetical protein
MRTTIRLDDEVLLEAKRHAAETHRTLTRVIQDALVALLQRERGADSPRRIRLPVFRGDGVFDGVDINNTASLVDRMELDR